MLNEISKINFNDFRFMTVERVAAITSVIYSGADTANVICVCQKKLWS